MKLFLPKLMVILTRQPRYLPEFSWESEFWTYKLFRAYETIFWRKYGIRKEISAVNRGGKLIVQAHSLEAALTLIEQGVRNLFKWKFPVKIWLPVLSSTIGLPSSSPFMFAIGFDTSAVNNTTSNPHTFSYTVTGSNPLIDAAADLAQSGVVPTGMTYNSVSLTGVVSLNPFSIMGMLLSVLGNPATGAHNISFAYSGTPTSVSDEFVSSFSGCNATGQPDSFNTGNLGGGSASSITVSTTVVKSNCWLVHNAATSGPIISSNAANTTVRQTSDASPSGNENDFGDSNATVGTGSQSQSVKNTGSNLWGMIVMSIQPTVVSQILKVSGVAQASISKVSSVTNANIKKVAGVLNQ